MDVFNFNTSDSSGMDGFFGSVTDAGQNILDVMSNNIIPNWAANQLGMQSNDTLSDPTYYQAAAPAPIVGQPTPIVGQPVQAQKTFLDTTNYSKFQMSPSTILMLGAVAIGAVLLLKRG